MTQEEWNNAARNSMFARMQTGAYPRRAINNGYSTATPTYNPYSVQFRRSDYNQPMPRYQTPPINQALTLTPQNQVEYVQTTNAYGQPVRVPTNAATQVGEVLNDYVVNPAWNWLKEKGAEMATLGALTAGGAVGASVYGGSPIGAARLAINSHSYLPSAIASFAATQIGRPIVSGLNSFVSNPYVQKVDRAIGKYGDWIKDMFF